MGDKGRGKGKKRKKGGKEWKGQGEGGEEGKVASWLLGGWTPLFKASCSTEMLPET